MAAWLAASREIDPGNERMELIPRQVLVERHGFAILGQACRWGSEPPARDQQADGQDRSFRDMKAQESSCMKKKEGGLASI